jgi:hypothetical protein
MFELEDHEKGNNILTLICECVVEVWFIKQFPNLKKLELINGIMVDPYQTLDVESLILGENVDFAPIQFMFPHLKALHGLSQESIPKLSTLGSIESLSVRDVMFGNAYTHLLELILKSTFIEYCYHGPMMTGGHLLNNKKRNRTLIQWESMGREMRVILSSSESNRFHRTFEDGIIFKLSTLRPLYPKVVPESHIECVLMNIPIPFHFVKLSKKYPRKVTPKHIFKNQKRPKQPKRF